MWERIPVFRIYDLILWIHACMEEAELRIRIQLLKKFGSGSRFRKSLDADPIFSVLSNPDPVFDLAPFFCQIQLFLRIESGSIFWKFEKVWLRIQFWKSSDPDPIFSVLPNPDPVFDLAPFFCPIQFFSRIESGSIFLFEKFGPGSSFVKVRIRIQFLKNYGSGSCCSINTRTRIFFVGFGFS